MAHDHDHDHDHAPHDHAHDGHTHMDFADMLPYLEQEAELTSPSTRARRPGCGSGSPNPR